LKERSFCVRLGMDADTDIHSLFAKARRMDPGRLVVSEIHDAEVREFFSLLAEGPHIGGLATLRADSVSGAVEAIVAAFGGDDAYARELIVGVDPILVHVHSDEAGRPRLAAIWSIAGLVDGELLLKEVDTGAAAASRLEAEA
jgi:type IV secretory pathway ATPase VirB11/archaellum biosynthesis ATPase